jgi:hypothetical protein
MTVVVKASLAQRRKIELTAMPELVTEQWSLAPIARQVPLSKGSRCCWHPKLPIYSPLATN